MSRVRMLFVMLPIVLAILFLGNAVIYQATALAFNIENAFLLLALAPVLGFLTLSFIASTFIGNYYYNFFTRAYYTVSAIWIGSFFYLFLASLIYGIVISISYAFVAIGPFILIAAALLCIYAVAHARKIVVTEVPIVLPRIPESWKGKKLVWVSDLHLGQVHGERFARKVVEKIMTLSPDMIFIGGDLFDGTGAPDITELVSPLTKLSAPSGIYYITGNHEEYGNRAVFLDAVKATGMRILDDEMIEVGGLQIIGVDYHNASDRDRFKGILTRLPIDASRASILLKHEPNDLDIAESAGVSLQISGHTHRGQLWPLAYIARLRYQGFDYGLKVFKNMQVFVSSGVGSWGPPMRVGTESEIVLFSL